MVDWIFSAIIVSLFWTRRICGAVWMETVSYTHLDVYKRQDRSDTEQKPENGETPDS